MQAITMSSILADGSKHTPAVEICSYLYDTRLSLVNKAFNRANKTLKERVGQELNWTLPEAVRVIEHFREEHLEGRAVHELLPALFQELSQAVETLLPLVPQNRTVTLRIAWGKMVQSYNACQQEEEGRAKEIHTGFFLYNLHHLKSDLARLRDHLANQNELQIHEDDPFNRCVTRLTCLVTFEKTRRRFDAVAGEENPLAACHASQKNAMNFSELSRATFSAHARQEIYSFTFNRFQNAESIILQSDFEKDVALMKMWGQIRQRVNAGPAADALASEIRPWMNSPENQAALAQVHHVGLSGLNILPPEISRLTALKHLHCNGTAEGRLGELPEEITQLNNLRSLRLCNNNFQEIPDVILRLPPVFLDLAGNDAIQILPDTIFRRYWGWILGFVGDGAEQFFSLGRLCGAQFVNDMWTFQHLRYAGLPPEQFTEIPFSNWFAERFSIPNIPLFVGGVGAFFLTFLGDAVMWLIARLVNLNESVRGKILALIVLIPSILFGLPIFLINLAVESIVTLTRDALDYSRMVRVRPDPVQPDPLQ